MTLSYPSLPGGDERPEASSSHSTDMNKAVIPCRYPESSYGGTSYGLDSEKDMSSIWGDDPVDEASSTPRWSDTMAYGATIAGKTFAKGVGALAAGAIYVAMTPAGLITTGFLKASESVLDWATSDYRNKNSQAGNNERSPGQQVKITWQEMQRERAREGLEPEFTHVAICGPAGSGKSSIINALRGLKNKDEGAAATGNVETTTEREKYRAHESLGQLVLHDCPGAGTYRNPLETYTEKQKLYLFNIVLIVHGERFGEIELNTIRSCIARGQPCVVIRSRSDEMTNRIKRDEDIETDEAKDLNIKATLEAFKAEFRRAGLPEKDLEYMTGIYMLVNNVDLRKLTVLPRDRWPVQAGETEIHERQLIQLLKGVANGRTVYE